MTVGPPDAGRGGSGQGDQLAASRAYCRRLTRQCAKNFYYGLMLTPQPKRSAMYAVYAWMRTADDLADQAGAASAKIERIEAFWQQTCVAMGSQPPPAGRLAAGERYDQIWPAVSETLRRFQVDGRFLRSMIDGQLADQRPQRYDRFEQLYEYCYNVASVVGLVCLTVWGYRGGEDTQKLAEYRGVALQLTNILRDLVEDADRGRVYLPTEDLQRFGFEPESFARQLTGGDVGSAFDGLMALEVDRARHYYELSRRLEDRIEPSCRSTSWALAQIYRRILEKIARHPQRVLAGTVRLKTVSKLGIALRAAWIRGLER